MFQINIYCFKQKQDKQQTHHLELSGDGSMPELGSCVRHDAKVPRTEDPAGEVVVVLQGVDVAATETGRRSRDEKTNKRYSRNHVIHEVRYPRSHVKKL